MTKNLKKIVSSVTALAIMISIGTASALEAYNGDTGNDNDENNFVKLECDRIEELPDGGKIYVYNIDGVENSFPVPQKGFQLSAANIKEL